MPIKLSPSNKNHHLFPNKHCNRRLSSQRRGNRDQEQQLNTQVIFEYNFLATVVSRRDETEERPIPSPSVSARKKVNRTPILEIHSDPSSPFIGLFRNHRISLSFPWRKERERKKRTREEKSLEIGRRKREKEREREGGKSKNKSEFGKIGVAERETKRGWRRKGRKKGRKKYEKQSIPF